MSRQAVALMAALGVGGVLGYWLKSTDVPRPEVIAPAPAVRQADGSLVAERRPATPSEAKKPPHQIPKGAREERRIAVTVQPTRPDCPPVRVDLSLVREGEGRRVVASSPDGQVVQALDLPVERALIPPPARPWAMGASYNPLTERAGIWVERDLAWLRIGADLIQDERGQVAAMVRVGWRF